ncbi:cobaltochelatase subunit CobN [Roseimaritima ulvae]|uniref:Aerobic cobaltochelatase subunit CobN n=1 Tax=Roseimaritima ulvae TaxID=980254 RepID=A0A5B9QMG0_9BACT|nr:cobaltochelatase subunit CobN [Roseimaritima ulvae]QEG38206.1 Aerobic cobaltochelatase subunit CobN [Roseimaritima ulvae]
MTHTTLRTVALLSLCLWTVARPHPTALHAQEAPPERSVLVLHTYLIAPAYVSTLRQAAEDAENNLQFVAVDSASAQQINTAIDRADLVLVDLPHASVVDGFLDKAAAKLGDSEVPYVLIGDRQSVRRGDSLTAGELPADRGVPAAWAATVRRYYRFGGKQNMQLLIAAFASQTDADLPGAVDFPEQGLYHPDWPEIETDLQTAIDQFADSHLPRVAIAINPAVLSASDTQWLDALIAALADQQINAYAFYGPRSNAQRFTQLTCFEDDENLTPAVDLTINAALVFRPQQRKTELDAVGVPVLQTLPALGASAEQWRSSKDGLSLADISYYYASSELAGMVDPILINARNEANGRLEPIMPQIQAVAAKAASIIRLQRSTPAERRVAMMVYNYPPGENNFGASFLNVPKSLVNVLRQMQQAGYTTTVPDEAELTAQVQTALRALYDPQQRAAFQADEQAAFISLSQYEAWFASLPTETQQRIEDYWGPPADMAGQGGANREAGFVIPSVRLGNVQVIPQPLRHELTTATGDELRKKRIGHKSTVPLSHTYLATYLYLREQWQAHAVVHFGTHGTLEWAPGKQRALSVDDDPMLGIGALPNIYPYIMDNLGEATTAKRRGRATMISHLTPMFTPAGFRPGLHAMHDLMHDWETIADGPVRAEMEKQLIASFVEHGLDRDLGWTPQAIADDFHGFMERLHPFLDDIAQTAQPQGLAVLGDVPSPQRRFGMVMQMLRKPLIDALGEDIDEVFLLDAEKVINSRPARWLRLALTNAEAASQLDLRKIDALDSGKQTSVPNRASDKQLDPKRLLALAQRAQQLDQALSENTELQSLLAALDGKHVPSSYGGDPVRNPESLPTGRNLYGFDPTRVPTQQAWQIGVGVLDEWIRSYQQQHDGQSPQQIGFTMWAGETMRHHGVMESQVLHALGVRPQWNSAGRMTGIEVVPRAELGRARLDVLLSVTGSYRDQFPQLMHWIDEAVREVAELDEPDNLVAQHSAALREELIAAGTSPQLAQRHATARVFSNQPGGYGTGLNNAVYASELWDSQTNGGGDAAMADLFTQRMGYAYGKDLDGVAAGELFRKQLAGVDAAFLSRSSNTYGVLTSDDAFAYLGGFSLAARSASGRTPELFVQNLRDENEVIIDSAGSSVAKELQTRYLHPQWIQAQQAEGYSGTLQVLKATQFLWGWQVTAPETVREDQWQSMMDVYVRDEYELGAKDWLQQDNQAALAQILEKMLDAVRLDYWHPDEATRQDLFTAYQAAKQGSELIESNRLVSQFVSAQQNRQPTSQPAAKADLAADPSVASMPDDSASNSDAHAESDAASERVRGMELQAVQQDAVTMAPQENWSQSFRIAMALGSILVLLLLGGWFQHRRLKSPD